MRPCATTSLPSFHLSARGIGAAAAFAAFEEVTRDIFAIGLPRDASAENFALEMISWHLGTVMLGSIRASALRFERSPQLVQRSGLDHAMVQLYREGGFTGSADGRPIRVEAGDICLFDLTGTLQTEASDFHNLTLLIPRPWLASALPHLRHLNGLVMDRNRPLTQLLAAHLEALTARAPSLSPREATAAARGTVALISTLLTDAATIRVADQPDLKIPSLLRQISAYIDANLADRALEPVQIAARFGLSRASLYRLFEPLGGVSEHIRRRRLAEASLRLASPAYRNARLSQIAAACGFANATALTRNFKAAFGECPSEARARADGLQAALPAPGPDASPERNFTVWMRTLRATGTD